MSNRIGVNASSSTLFGSTKFVNKTLLCVI
jgi:hypothetical protein